MNIFYYFLTNISTGEKRIIPMDSFIGDINDTVVISTNKYKIDDYSIEYENEIIPEDFYL